MKREIWVVEQFCGKEWWPCEDAKLLKKNSLRNLKIWEDYDPIGKYRVTKYVSKKAKEKVINDTWNPFEHGIKGKKKE